MLAFELAYLHFPVSFPSSTSERCLFLCFSRHFFLIKNPPNNILHALIWKMVKHKALVCKDGYLSSIYDSNWYDLRYLCICRQETCCIYIMYLYNSYQQQFCKVLFIHWKGEFHNLFVDLIIFGWNISWKWHISCNL